ncbi:thiamine ABC transporter permease [Xaviernesmea oryzae]|uniref:Thiamine ABC transporter permease n=1 Tax=Xaviernesmea oryzae TaxID=464029 RepID=A0A1Q9B0L4_9HYPH|nr:ABC transporter ATP-binding protein [Xaviernesmea oryzae]OLP61539.1 thiamine ABC transporter permease [Xaviernesmea oryzae]
MRRLLGYYRPHIPLLAADLAAAGLLAACTIYVPLGISHLVHEIGAGPEAHERLIAPAAILLAALGLQLAAQFFVDHWGHVMGARIEADVRRHVFDHCQQLPFSFHDRTRTGQLMSRMTSDPLWLGELFHHGPEDLFIGALKYGGAITVLFLLDPVIAWSVLAITPFAIASALHFNRAMNRAIARSKQEIGAINDRIEDTLSGIRVVQAFAQEQRERQRFEALNLRFLASRADSYRSEAWFSLCMDGLAQLITALVLLIGTLHILSERLTAADLLTLVLTVGILVDPVKRLANVIRLWQEGYTGFVRAMEILEIVPDLQERAHALPLSVTKGEITFDRVRFGYEGKSDIIGGLSFALEGGDFVALVGASGVGKSTLCALIARFYDLRSGTIRIDGTDISTVTLASLREAVGFVQQDTYLFAGTIAENLRYGRPNASMAEIEAAARAAQAEGFIHALPRGYETEVGPRGVTLSGGQRQRLAIARLFLKNPPILIFDEATSALDNDSERAVQDALMALSKGRTTLVIAHRLSTIRRADRILVLTEDGLVEDGTHDRLMAASGAYAKLHGSGAEA